MIEADIKRFVKHARDLKMEVQSELFFEDTEYAAIAYIMDPNKPFQFLYRFIAQTNNERISTELFIADRLTTIKLTVDEFEKLTPLTVNALKIHKIHTDKFYETTTEQLKNLSKNSEVTIKQMLRNPV